MREGMVKDVRCLGRQYYHDIHGWREEQDKWVKVFMERDEVELNNNLNISVWENVSVRDDHYWDHKQYVS